MFFTRVGRIVAWLAIVLAVIKIGFALIVLQSGDPGVATTLLGSKTTGQQLDQGIYTLVFGIVIGVLTDISWSVARGDRS